MKNNNQKTGVVNLGQIGAGKVLEFTPKAGKRWVSLPVNAKPSDRFAEFEISGDSLNGISIYDGDVLLCRKNFEMSEVKPPKVCIVLILKTGDLLAKIIQINDNNTVTLMSANPKYPPKICSSGEIQILGLAIEVRRPI